MPATTISLLWSSTVPQAPTPCLIVCSMLCRCHLLAAHHLQIRLQPQLQGGRHAYEMHLQQDKQ